MHPDDTMGNRYVSQEFVTVYDSTVIFGGIRMPL